MLCRIWRIPRNRRDFTPRDRSFHAIREAQSRKKPRNLCALREFLKLTCRSCFVRSKSMFTWTRRTTLRRGPLVFLYLIISTGINLLLVRSFSEDLGENLAVSTALGITETICGLIEARSTVFSRLQVKEEQRIIHYIVNAMSWFQGHSCP